MISTNNEIPKSRALKPKNIVDGAKRNNHGSDDYDEVNPQPKGHPLESKPYKKNYDEEISGTAYNLSAKKKNKKYVEKYRQQYWTNLN